MCAESGESYVRKWLSVFDKVKDDPETVEAIKDVSLTLVQSFPDLDGASFSVIIKDGKLSYQEGEIPNYETKVSVASSDFEGLVTEELSAMMAIQQGLIEIDGDLGGLLNLAYLMGPMKEHWLAISQE